MVNTILQKKRRYNQEGEPRVQEPRRMQADLSHHVKGNIARCFRKVLVTNKRRIADDCIKLTRCCRHHTHETLPKKPGLTVCKEIFYTNRIFMRGYTQCTST